ncbi:hypothetical protein AB0F30_24095 [Streptomyces sp. NPDC029006]|uniref:hypothetical protein n=1 Tax=Streptomyces sp. NPDC029006 TaxID=3155467 RepID=UPI0033CFC351
MPAGLRERGLLDTDGRYSGAGRQTKQRIEALIDGPAAPPAGRTYPPYKAPSVRPAHVLPA